MSRETGKTDEVPLGCSPETWGKKPGRRARKRKTLGCNAGPPLSLDSADHKYCGRAGFADELHLKG